MCDAIGRWAELTNDQDRHLLLAELGGTLRPELVKDLCDRVVTELGSDLDLAERLAQGARFLADQLDDDYCRGRGYRALSIVCVQRRDYPAAVAHAETALRCFDRVGNHLETAITRSSGLHSLSHLGFHDRALEWAEAAGDTFSRLGDDLRLARLRLNVGTMLARQDRFSEALEHYRSAHRAFLGIGRVQDVGTSLRNIAVTLQCDNQLEGALEAYREARSYCEQNDLPLLVLEIDYNTAYLHYLRGEYAKALELFEAGRQSCEALGDRQHMALCDLEQSEIYLELNLVTEAAHLAERGRDEFERLEMGYELAKCLTNLALAKGRMRKSDRALELLDRARHRFIEEHNVVWAAIIDLYRSQILLAGGDLRESTRFAQRASRVFEEHHLPGRAARCEIQLARLALRGGDAEQARILCSKALTRLRPLKSPVLDYQVWSMIGESEEQLGNFSAAAEALRKAESMLERLRSHLQTDELKISFLEDKAAVFERLVDLGYHRLGADPQALFNEIERAKSRGLIDLLAVRVDTIRTKSDQGEAVERLKKLRRQLNGYYRRLDSAETETDPQSMGRVERLRGLILESEDDLLRALRSLQSTDQELSSLQQGTVPGIEDVQTSLPDHSVLLEYFFARGTVYLCVVRKDQLDVVALGSTKHIEEALRAFRYQLSKLLLDRSYVAQFQAAFLRDVRRHLKVLYDALIPPLVRELHGHHLIVVPHGPLHYLPFHALFDGERYLIDRVSISFAPSAGVYSLCRNKPPGSGRGALVLGAADERAPLIVKEAETVADTLSDARLFIGPDAGEHTLREHGPESRLVHLAAHGHYRRDNPMFSSIQLGTGRLSLFDLYNLELDADLVVLSGCGTGLSDVRQGDELVGLTRGLLYAGARSVAVSLWDVNDATTTELMRRFYLELETRPDPATALREAMLALRESHPHPYYWAPFILIGDAFGRSMTGQAVAERAVRVEPSTSGLLG